MLKYLKDKKDELRTDYVVACKEAQSIKAKIEIIDELINDYEAELAEKETEEEEEPVEETTPEPIIAEAPAIKPDWLP